MIREQLDQYVRALDKTLKIRVHVNMLGIRFTVNAA